MRTIATVAALLVALTGVADAQAKHRRHHHERHHHAKQAESFDGTCEFSGAVEFTPPMTNTPQPTAQHADAPGTCTGTFVDRFGVAHKLDNAAARDLSDSSGDNVSCLFGLATGAGTLFFPDGAIDFTMTEYRPGATPLIRFDGKAGGGAWMPVTPSQKADPVAALQACGGSGLSKFELDAHMRTDGVMSG